jgi:hypothetical protein
LSPHVWELVIEKVGKYGIGKRSVVLVFANILKFVIDIPLPGKIMPMRRGVKFIKEAATKTPRQSF